MFFDFNRPSNPIGFLDGDNDEFALDIGSIAQKFDVDDRTGEISVDPNDTRRFFVCEDPGDILTVLAHCFSFTDLRSTQEETRTPLKSVAKSTCFSLANLRRSKQRKVSSKVF
jgi:hypothetical protein